MRKFWLYIVLCVACLPVYSQVNTDQVLRIGQNALYFEDYMLSIQYFNLVIQAKPEQAKPYFYRAIAKFNLEDYRGAEEDATFAPYEEIAISDEVTIVLLSDVSEIELPSEYVSQEVSSTKGHEFPAWRNEEYPDFIILYAINNSGEKSLYQLDNAEGTYQRFNAPEVVREELNDTFIGKLSEVLEH